jgi:hypothetical protein
MGMWPMKLHIPTAQKCLGSVPIRMSLWSPLYIYCLYSRPYGWALHRNVNMWVDKLAISREIGWYQSTLQLVLNLRVFMRSYPQSVNVAVYKNLPHSLVELLHNPISRPSWPAGLTTISPSSRHASSVPITRPCACALPLMWTHPKVYIWQPFSVQAAYCHVYGWIWVTSFSQGEVKFTS